VARQSLQPSRDPADYDFVHRLRTRFAETDAMGIIHHGAYLPYLEEARVEYLRAIGHPYDSVRAGEGDDEGTGGRDFAVLEVSVQYRKPLRFDDEVEVSLVIGAVTGTTFQIGYLLAVAGEARATAVTVHGCVDGRGRPARLPAWVREVGEAEVRG
jgi:acyl-CoA thioester hydrolase